MSYSIKRIFVISIIIIISILLITSNSSGLRKLIPVSAERTIPVNSGWKYRLENSKESGILTFPCVIKGVLPNKMLLLSNTLPDQNFDSAALLIRTSQQYLKVYIDGKLIYDYSTEIGQATYLLPGSSWHFIKLPQSYEGKKVQISILSPYKQYSGHINSIYMGSGSSLVLKILYSYGSIFVISCLILLIGIICIILYFTIKCDEGRFTSLLYLGLFSLLSGTWIASESKVIQFLINSPSIIFIIACITLFLMPIPLFLFILSIYRPEKSYLLTVFIWIFSSFFVIISILQLINKGTFMCIMLYFHILLLISMITLIYISFSEMINGKKMIKLFFLGCIVLCAFSMKNLFNFYFTKIPGLNAEGYLQFGILLFILLLSASLGQYIIEIFNDQTRNKIYKKMAYTDILTGLKNRTSYEEKISEVNRNLGLNKNASVIIFDLNNLKLINDSFGHDEGDHLIYNSANLINDCFNGIGQAYRIGGDEFAVIITEFEESVVSDRIVTFEKNINDYNCQNNKQEINIAYGMSAFDQNHDSDFRPVILRADEAMYSCKRLQKQING